MKNQLGELVRVSVEEMLNKMLDTEVDQLTNAAYMKETQRKKIPGPVLISVNSARKQVK